MEFQKLIKKRRSVRKYSAGHTIPKEDILEMIRAAQEAPSWKNSQTGRYYCLLSEEMTQQFRTDCLPSQCPEIRKCSPYCHNFCAQPLRLQTGWNG